MQNLKSLDNLIQKPVLGANDDIHRLAHREDHVVDIYSYEDEMADITRGIEEPQRRILWKQMFPQTHQD